VIVMDIMQHDVYRTLVHDSCRSMFIDTMVDGSRNHIDIISE
jgi:hypothetical protein